MDDAHFPKLRREIPGIAGNDVVGSAFHCAFEHLVAVWIACDTKRLRGLHEDCGPAYRTNGARDSSRTEFEARPPQHALVLFQ